MIGGFGFSGESEIFKKAGTTLDNGLFLVCSFFGTVFLSLGCAFVGGYTHATEIAKVNSILTFATYLFSNPWIWIAISIVLFGFGTIGVYFDQKTIENENKRIKKDNEKVDDLKLKIDVSQEEGQALRSEIQKMHKKLVETWLKGVCKQINLCTHSRVSIYYENNESFFLLARYSANPSLAKTHKIKFGLNEGVISRAWKHGHHVEDESPIWNPHSPEEYSTYMQKEYGYSSEKLDAITMKSCRFFGLAIREADESIGVILFESEKDDALGNEIRDKIEKYCGDYQSHLSGFVRDGLAYDKSASIPRSSTRLTTDLDVIEILRRGEGEENIDG